MEEDEEIIIPQDVTLIRIYDWLPYSHWRLEEILKNNYGLYPVCIRGYKEGRYPGYKQHYQLREIETKKILIEYIHLDTLRKYFAKKNIPLIAENKIYSEFVCVSNRNPKAQRYLEIVKHLQEEEETIIE